jgi:hypothetical protein
MQWLDQVIDEPWVAIPVSAEDAKGRVAATM